MAQGAGADGLGAVVEQRVAGAAAVPDLQEDAPPALCTASVTCFQPATWASEWMPGSCRRRVASMAMVASAISRPALARWA
jgi:hypothetical protein